MDADRISARQWGLIYLVSLLWGSSFLLFEIGLRGMEPLTLVALRLVTAAACMLLLFPGRAESARAVWRHRGRLSLLGLAGCALPFACYATGQQYVNSSTAGVINAMMPAFTFLVAVLAGQEAFSPLRLAGALAGIAGVAMLLGPDGLGDGGLLLGVILCLTATVFYGAYAVAARRVSREIDPATMATGMVCWGAVLSLPAAVAVEGIPGSAPGAGPLLAGCVLGIFGTAVAYRIFIRLISSIGATNSSITTLIVPINAVVIGVLVLGERLDSWFAAGTVTILASIILIDGNLRRTVAAAALRRAERGGTQ